MTNDQLIERLVSALSANGADHSCVKLSRNAKGETQIEVSVRTDSAEILTADDASVKAQAVYDAMAEKYRTAQEPLTGEQVLDAIFALPIASNAKKEVMGLLSLAMTESPKPAKTRKNKPQPK